MSISTQYRIPFFRNPNQPRLAVQRFSFLRASATSTKTQPQNLNNRVVIVDELQLVQSLSSLPTLAPTVLREDKPKVNDPSLQSTWTHRAWIASGSISILISLLKSISVATETNLLLEPVLAGLLGYILADLGSGVYHWGIDNYGDASTPLFGSQIEAFQGHHKWPWTITRREFANNLHGLARALTFFVLPIDLICHEPVANAFIGVFCGCIMFSQQFHSWAHGTKSKLPPLVLALQDARILVSRSEHGAHHRPPYNNNYCIVSGAWNKILDENKVFEALEMVIYFKFGIRPRSWSEPNSDWTEEMNSPPNGDQLHIADN